MSVIHEQGTREPAVELRRGWAWRDVVALHRQRHRRPDGQRRRAAILLGGTTPPALVRAARRLTGEAVPPPFCRVTPTAPTLMEKAIHRASWHVDEAAIHTIVDRRQRRWGEPMSSVMPGSWRWVPADNGSAVSVLAGLVPALVHDPEATVLILPVTQSLGDEEAFRRAVDRAFNVASISRDVVAVGAESTGPIGAHDWLLPFAPRWLVGSKVVPSARFVASPSEASVDHLMRSGGLLHTGVIVARGCAWLDLFEELTPRLLRLFLYGAAMPARESETFAVQAQEGLGALDLSRDLVALTHRLRAVCLPSHAGWLDLRSPTRMATWFVRERHQQQPSYPLCSHRRRLAPDELTSTR